MKLQSGGEDRWVAAGYQVRFIRAAPPLTDPIILEQTHRSIIEVSANANINVLIHLNKINPTVTDVLFLFEQRTPEVEGEGVLRSGEFAGEFRGEGDGEYKPLNPESIEDRVFKFMVQLLKEENVVDETKAAIVPMWRAVEITGLVTPIPDETVPPPPMPAIPMPPPEPVIELTVSLY